MITGRKEISASLPSAFAPLHPHTSFLFQSSPPSVFQAAPPPPPIMPPLQDKRSPPYTPTDSTSPNAPTSSSPNSTITHCTILGCCVCESEGPVATEFSSTSWTAILKLVLSVLHYHHSKQDYFANNIITHFVKTHWDKISGSKKWNADWKSRISDCLSHNSKCFDSSERGKWRLKDRQHVEETIMRMKEKDREWRRSRDPSPLSMTMSMSSISSSSSSSSSTSSPSSHVSPPLVTPLNLRMSNDLDELSYAMDATYTSPRSPKKQRLSSDSPSSLTGSSGLSPRIGSLSLSAPGYPHEVTTRTTLSPRAHSPKGSPRSNPISPRALSPRQGTSSPRNPLITNASPRTSLLHYAQHMNSSSPVFPFTPTPSAQIPTPSSGSSSLSSSGGSINGSMQTGSPTSQTQDILPPFTLPPLDDMDVVKEDAPTITISAQTILPPRLPDPNSPSGRVPLLNLTGEEQMARARWTDYRTSQDRMTVDRFLTVVPSG